MSNLLNIAKNKSVQNIIDLAIKEDLGGAGDVTSKALVTASTKAHAYIFSRGRYTVSGTSVAKRVFEKIDQRNRCVVIAEDGETVGDGDVIMRVEGPARSILTAERTALNFLQRMTGIATLTSRFVAKVRKYGVMILDTRKTTPGLRALEKYAVLCGGGTNHRMGLYDMVLIKDNHRKLWVDSNGGGLDMAVKKARSRYPGLAIEIEVESESELKSVLNQKPEWILLDNMTPAQMARCVKIVAGRCKLEASGGIKLQNVTAVAKTGVTAISLGCLTHSAVAADLSLEII